MAEDQDVVELLDDPVATARALVILGKRWHDVDQLKAQLEKLTGEVWVMVKPAPVDRREVDRPYGEHL